MVRLTDRPDMTLDVYRGPKTTLQQQQQLLPYKFDILHSLQWLYHKIMWTVLKCVLMKRKNLHMLSEP